MGEDAFAGGINPPLEGGLDWELSMATRLWQIGVGDPCAA